MRMGWVRSVMFHSAAVLSPVVARIDTQDRVVDVSDSDFPADRTELRCTTPLRPW